MQTTTPIKVAPHRALETLVLDTETTGLQPGLDEVIEVAIVNSDAEEFFHSFVRPMRIATWPEAQAVNGISPSDVASAPTLDEIKSDIVEIIRGNRVVIYNAAFDTEMLAGLLDEAGEIVCAMEAFSAQYADLQETDSRWIKLQQAACFVGHEWGQDPAHRALNDSRACLSVWRWLNQRDPARFPV